MKLKFTAPLDWPHEGGILHFDEAQEVETDNDLLIKICLQEGWAVEVPDAPKRQPRTPDPE